MATNIFIYWSDGLGGQAFDHHNRNGGGGHLPTEIDHRAGHLSNFFKCPGYMYAWSGCPQHTGTKHHIDAATQMNSTKNS